MRAKPNPAGHDRVTVSELPERKVQLLFDTKSDKSKFANDIPDQLKVAISPELWASYSPIRRDSFKMLFVNPNSFFYRNRPPGDPQRFGPFTAEEEAQFLERIRYFREELGIREGMWGLFAAPLRGRVGYQCSNFYRTLVQEGKINDASYEVAEDGKLRFIRGGGRQCSRESQRALEEEAFRFVKGCISGLLEVPMPVKVDGDGEARRVKKVRKNKAACGDGSVDEPIVIAYKDTAVPAPEHASHMQMRKPLKADSENEGDEPSPLRYARDSLTGLPMEAPYMDARTGVVLDLKTWRRVLSGQSHIAVNTRACSVDDLVKMTGRNFHRYCFDIVNVRF